MSGAQYCEGPGRECLGERLTHLNGWCVVPTVQNERGCFDRRQPVPPVDGAHAASEERRDVLTIPGRARLERQIELVDQRAVPQDRPKRDAIELAERRRVARLERDLPSSGLNPNPDSAPNDAARALGEDAAGLSPAAPGRLGTVGTPDTPDVLKKKLVAARKRALAASQQNAQQAYDQALEDVSKLARQAREAGVDPKVLELYEAGLTKPPQ